MKDVGLLNMDANVGRVKDVYVDVGDVLYYLSHHSSVSGIQRVVIEIWEQLKENKNINSVPVLFNSKSIDFSLVPKNEFEELLRSLDSSSQDRNLTNQAHELANLSLDSEAISVSNPSVLLILGAAWHSHLYFDGVNKLKAQGVGVLALVYDLIPIMSKSFPQALQISFTHYIFQLLLLADRIATISKFTKTDLESFAAMHDIACPPGSVTRLPGGFINKTVTSKPEDSLLLGKYILMVGTIEERKNHLLAIRAFRRVVDDLGQAHSPSLVIVGRYGWNIREFIDEISTDKQLSSKVILLTHSVTDNQLAQLYKNSLFTIYPSLYEGWGLPVSESLDFGIPVIASNSSSIPEAGESFAAYVDPSNQEQLASAMLHWITDEKSLNTQRKLIETRTPLTWHDVTKVIVDEINSIETVSGKFTPTLELDTEYGFGRIGPIQNFEDGLAYKKELQRRRSLPMTNRILEPKDTSLAEFSLEGPNKIQSESGASFSTNSQAISIDLSFVRSSERELKVIIAVESNHNKVRIKAIHPEGSAEEILTCGTTTTVELPPNPVGYLERITFVMESLLADTSVPLQVTFSSVVVIRSDDYDAELKATKFQQSAQHAFANKAAAVDGRVLYLEERIRSLESSASWKITSPVRALARTIRKFI